MYFQAKIFVFQEWKEINTYLLNYFPDAWYFMIVMT